MILDGVAEEQHTHLVTIRPNPITSIGVIEIEIVRSGSARVAVVDVLGRSVATVFDGRLSVGRHTLPLSMDGLAVGGYYLVVETETGRVVELVRVVR